MDKLKLFIVNNKNSGVYDNDTARAVISSSKDKVIEHLIGNDINPESCMIEGVEIAEGVVIDVYGHDDTDCDVSNIDD